MGTIITLAPSDAPECTFCGLDVPATSPEVFCEDCQTRHPACPTCADEVPSVEGYRLVA